jgi:hypothetical protein
VKKLHRKPTLQETLEATEKAMRYHASMMGKPMADEFNAPDRKPKREVINPSDPSQLEAAVMREVAAVIQAHPSVALAWRQNSGSAYMLGAGGKSVPVSFWKPVRGMQGKTLLDFMGMLTNGTLFGIECKRRNWTKPSGSREGEQLEMILRIKYAGGRAGFAVSGEQATEILNDPR